MSTVSDNTNYLFGKWLSSPSTDEEVVISGISGRFPNSHNVQDYLENLINKVDMTNSGNRRWDVKHPEYPKRCGNLYEIDKADPGFFGLHYRQANNMDPAMRIMLETTIEAIIDAGFNPEELKNTKTAVFVCVSWSEMEHKHLTTMTKSQTFAVLGYLRSLQAHRISYFLKLNGPSYVLDSACSSSLAAIDEAFRFIRSGICDNAIVSTANIFLHPGLTLQLKRTGVLALDGIVKVFDKNANGYARSELVGSMFLQKQKNCRRNYAQIINCKQLSTGAHEYGINFPSTSVQAKLLEEIYHESGKNSDDLSYLEVHCTGTAVGDPVEIKALEVLTKTRYQPLLIGSVKSCAGHSEPSSGFASLIKVLIAMETGKIPPNLNLKEIKADLEGLCNGSLIPVLEITNLEKENAIIGINNFGFGGTNAHLIIRRFPKVKTTNIRFPTLVCFSGRTENAVKQLLEDLKTKHLDFGYITLLHKIYRYNISGHLYRSSWILHQSATLEFKVCKIKPQLPELNLFFGKLNNDVKLFLNDLVTNIPFFKSFFDRVKNILQIYNTENLDLATISGMVQLGVFLFLNKIDLKFKKIDAEFTGNYVLAFYEKRLTFNQTIKAIALKTTINLSQNNKIFSKNSIVFDVSNSFLKKNHLKVYDLTSFLEALGSLYQKGFNFEISELYPEAEFPVSRGTSMISSKIQWNHNRKWYTYNYKQAKTFEYFCEKYPLSLSKDLEGHVVNGVTLVPVSKILVLVWKTFAEHCYNLQIEDCPIVFNHCRFLETLMVPKVNDIVVLILLQRNGNFEVIANNSLLVNGNIQYGIKENFTYFPKITLSSKNEETLIDEDIYKELNLRGFNFSGLFKGLIKCNLEATVGLLKWENNWMSFLTNMMMIKNLQTNCRDLQIPIYVKKIHIKPMEHLNIIKNLSENNILLTVYASKSANILRAGNVEVYGLQTKSIQKKENIVNPVLHKYEFIPNKGCLPLALAVRVNTQIVYENNLEDNFEAIEVIDEFTESDRFLLPLVNKTLKSMNYVVPNLKISSKKNITVPDGIKKDKIILSSLSELKWIICSNILTRPKDLKNVVDGLSSNGFILTRENQNFKFVASDYANLELFTEFVTETEKLILLKKIEAQLLETQYFKIDEVFNWIEPLKDVIMSKTTQVILYASNHNSNGLLGLVHTLRREPQGTKIKAFFTFDDDFGFDIMQFSQQTQMAINVFKNGQRGTYRHLPIDECKKKFSEDSFYDLKANQWIRNSPIDKISEDRVYVYYSALNYKQKDKDQENMRMAEYSGIRKNGKKVFGIAHQASQITTILRSDDFFTWTLPDTWSLKDAATIPFAYSTAIYSLLLLTKIKQKSSILIHNATNNIGLAAINICQHFNCNVFLTVSTLEQKQFVTQHFSKMPDENISYTNSTSFERIISKTTNKRGVDTVLNLTSVPNLKHLESSIRSLGFGGVLIQIGKLDLKNYHNLNLFLLKKNVTFSSFNSKNLFNLNEDLKRKIFDFVNSGMKLGFVKSLPAVIFRQEDIDKAIDYATIEKTLITLRSENSGTNNFRSKNSIIRHYCNPDKSYLILGGLGGVGLELTNWLFLRGARKIVLTSRFGLQTGYQTLQIKKWESQGATVCVIANYCVTKEKCKEVISKANRLGPVDSIYNLATDVQDSMFENQSKKMFELSLAPKATVTRILDHLTRELCPQLKHFVTFSSVSCGFGNPGTTNYSMANSVMERICEKRKLEGFPGLAIQWGAVADVGIVRRMQKLDNQVVVVGGTLPQSLSSFFDSLDLFLEQDNPVVSCMILPKKNKQKIKTTLVETVTSILGLKSLSSISQHSNLSQLGMDSMMIAEVTQTVKHNFGISLATKDVRLLTFAKLATLEGRNSRKDTKSIN